VQKEREDVGIGLMIEERKERVRRRRREMHKIMGSRRGKRKGREERAVKVRREKGEEEE
jgi:hypothetical protein